MTATTYKFEATEIYEAAELINEHCSLGHKVRVSGSPTARFSKSPATVWSTGSMSVSVQAQSSSSKIRNLWYRADKGSVVVVEIEL